MNKNGLAEFARGLHTEVIEKAESEAAEGMDGFSEMVFTNTVLNHFVELGLSPEATSCYYARDKKRGAIKVNGFSIDESTDRLDLFVCLYFADPGLSKVSAKQTTDTVKLAWNFIRNAETGKLSLEPSSEESDMIDSIMRFLNAETKLRIFVLTDGKATLKKKNMKQESKTGRIFEVQIWDIERLYRSMHATIPKEEIEIDFESMFDSNLRCLPMPLKSPNYETYISILPGNWLFQLYEEFGSGLLEFNVRSFLQISGKVNRGIRKTLREDPDSFLAYNNGLTATVDEIEFHKDDSSFITKVKGLQIVNGGQTTASIHRAGKKDKADLSRVQVPIKITRVASEHLLDMVPKISMYANSQNPVNITDFSSNDQFHIDVERLSRAIWTPDQEGQWFYERARGQYSEAQEREANTPAKKKAWKKRTPTSRKFTKTDMAKHFQSWEQFPYQVSYGAQKNFVYFQQWLHEFKPQNKKADDVEWAPDEQWFKQLIAKTIIFKRTNLVVGRKGVKAYKANIAAYLVSYLSSLSSRTGKQFDLDLVWKNQDISSELYDLLDSWVRPIENAIRNSADKRNISEWCKKRDCWDAVKALDLPFDERKIPELASNPIPPAEQAELGPH